MKINNKITHDNDYYMLEWTKLNSLMHENGMTWGTTYVTDGIHQKKNDNRLIPASKSNSEFIFTRDSKRIKLYFPESENIQKGDHIKIHFKGREAITDTEEQSFILKTKDYHIDHK